MAKIGSVLASGQSLTVGDYLISPNGLHIAQMQGDGNFVIYYSDPKTAALTDAYWASNTARATGQYLAIFQGDGNFVLYRGSDPKKVTSADAYWASNTVLGSGQYVAILQNDGNLAFYHGSDPGRPGPLYWSSLPQAVVQNKFMQNYRVSSPVNGGDDVVAVCNSLGQTELFTIGKEGDVHTIFPDSSSETGYNEARITTGLHVTSLAAGLDSQGHTIVLAAATPGPALYYVVEDTKATPRWSTPQKVGNLPVPSGATDLARIITQEIAGNLYVALVFTMRDGTCSICSSIWQTGSPAFQTLPEPTFMLSNPNGIWQGSTAKNAAYVSFPYMQGAAASQIWLYFPSTNSTASGAAHLGSGYSNRQVVSIDSTLDGSGTSQVFVVLDDGNTYRLSESPIGQYGQAQFSWVPLGQSTSAQQVVVETDRGGNAQVFVLSQPNASHLNVLSQWIPEADSPTGYAALPIPIHEGTGLQLAGVRNDGGSIDLFCVDAYNHITHLFQEEESGTWAVETVETPGGPVEEYASYATDVTLYDSMGEVLVNTPVSILASEEARITVNGATFFIDDNRPAHIRSNSAGLLSITQETGSLATPSLQIKVLSPQWMPTIPDIVIKPYTGVQQSLVDVTPEMLLKAKLPDGTPLLDEQYHTQQDAESVAAAIQQCMGMMGAGAPKLAASAPASPSLSASPPSAHTSPHPRARHPMAAHYTHARSSRPAAHMRLLPAPEQQQHWRLSFEGGHASYQKLSQPEAAQLFANTQSTLQAASSVLDFFSDLADIVQGAFEEILHVTEIVVQTVEDGLKTMITFVIGDQKCFFEAVISFVEQVFDLVEAVFTSIAVFFEKLYKWLAWLFSWPDILRSKEALAHTIEQYLEYLQGAASGYKRLVDANFATLKDKVADWFQQARDAAAQSSIGGYLQLNTTDDPVFLSAISNNFLFNELINNLFGTPVLDWLMSFFAEVAKSAAPQALTGLASQVEGDPAFSKVVDFFLNLVESPGQLFSILLKDVYGAVEMLVQAAISGIQSLVDTLMDVAASLVLSVRNTLNKPWDIPFVSQFYSFIAGGDLTTLDLISLIMAIPTTILYKLTYSDAAPFPDEDSVTAFKNSFKASQMLQASAFPTASATLLASSLPAAIELSETALSFLAMGYMVSQAVGGVTTSLLDLVAIPDALPSEELRTLLPIVPKLTFIDYLMSVCSVACRFELFYTEAVWDCSTDGHKASAFANWNYALVGIFSYIVFAYFASQGIIESGLPKSSDAIAILTSIAGGISLVLSSEAASTGEEDPAKSVWRIMLSVPWLFKFLRYSKLAIRTEGDSLVLLTVIDGACYVPGAFLGFTVLTP